MNRKSSQNIYETAASHAPNEKVWRGDATGEAASWLREQRRMKLQSWLFVLVVIAFGILISIVAAQYYLLSQVPPEHARSVFELEVSDSPDYRILTSGGRGKKSTAEDLLVVDEYADMRLISPPKDGPAPLSATWVKQAGYYISRAEKAYQDNNPEDALAMYDQVIAIYPEIQGVHHYRGLCYLQMGDAAAAAEAFAMADDQESPAYGLENNLGVSYMTLKDYVKAEEHFLRAVEKKPDYSLALLNLGTLYVRTDRPDKAVEYYERYLQLKPGDLQAGQAYATLLLKQESWAKALPVLTGIVRQAPELAPAWFQLGETLSRTGSTDDAIKSLQKGSSLMDPRNALALLAEARFDGLRTHEGFRELVSSLGASGD